jgi:hypothetical protein
MAFASRNLHMSPNMQQVEQADKVRRRIESVGGNGRDVVISKVPTCDEHVRWCLHEHHTLRKRHGQCSQACMRAVHGPRPVSISFHPPVVVLFKRGKRAADWEHGLGPHFHEADLRELQGFAAACKICPLLRIGVVGLNRKWPTQRHRISPFQLK